MLTKHCLPSDDFRYQCCEAQPVIRENRTAQTVVPAGASEDGSGFTEAASVPSRFHAVTMPDARKPHQIRGSPMNLQSGHAAVR